MILPVWSLWLVLGGSPPSLPAPWTSSNGDALPCPATQAAAPATACKCGFNTVEGELASSRAVFSGVVLHAGEWTPAAARSDSAGATLRGPTGPQPVTLRVTRGWKGAVAGDTITVGNLVVCGVIFQPGGEYLVYAHDYEPAGGLFTSPCQRTRRIAPPNDGWMEVLPPTSEEMALLDRIAPRAARP